MPNQRREKIMDLLREDGSAKVANLARLFKVTEVTIRQDLEKLAGSLLKELERVGVKAQQVESIGRCGGGTLPEVEIESIAVEVLCQGAIEDNDHTFAEVLYKRLMQARPPILAVLREGRILLDVLTLFAKDIPDVARVVSEAIFGEGRT